MSLAHNSDGDEDERATFADSSSTLDDLSPSQMLDLLGGDDDENDDDDNDEDDGALDLLGGDDDDDDDEGEQHEANGSTGFGDISDAESRSKEAASAKPTSSGQAPSRQRRSRRRRSSPGGSTGRYDLDTNSTHDEAEASDSEAEDRADLADGDPSAAAAKDASKQVQRASSRVESCTSASDTDSEPYSMESAGSESETGYMPIVEARNRHRKPRRRTDWNGIRSERSIFKQRKRPSRQGGYDAPNEDSSSDTNTSVRAQPQHRRASPDVTSKGAHQGKKGPKPQVSRHSASEASVFYVSKMRRLETMKDPPKDPANQGRRAMLKSATSFPVRNLTRMHVDVKQQFIGTLHDDQGNLTIKRGMTLQVPSSGELADPPSAETCTTSLMLMRRTNFGDSSVVYEAHVQEHSQDLIPGTVGDWIATHKFQLPHFPRRAVKVYRHCAGPIEGLASQEIKTYQDLLKLPSEKLGHFLKLYAAFDHTVKDEKDETIVYKHKILVMEHYGISLEMVMKRYHTCRDEGSRGLRLNTIYGLLFQMSRALSYLNDAGLVHCDVQPAHILMARRLKGEDTDLPTHTWYKLTSFGQCREIDQSDMSPFTLHDKAIPYSAPERILAGKTVESTDTWSLACIAAEMCLGKRLFTTDCEYQLLHQHQDLIGQVLSGIDARGGGKFDRFFCETEYGDIVWRKYSNYEYKKPGHDGTMPKLPIRQLAGPDFAPYIDALRDPQAKTKKSDSESGSGGGSTQHQQATDFAALLNDMFDLRPAARLKPSQLIEHGTLVKAKQELLTEAEKKRDKKNNRRRRRGNSTASSADEPSSDSDAHGLPRRYQSPADHTDSEYQSDSAVSSSDTGPPPYESAVQSPPPPRRARAGPRPPPPQHVPAASSARVYGRPVAPMFAASAAVPRPRTFLAMQHPGVRPPVHGYHQPRPPLQQPGPHYVMYQNAMPGQFVQGYGHQPMPHNGWPPHNNRHY